MVRSPRGRRAPHPTIQWSSGLLLRCSATAAATGNGLLGTLGSACIRAGALPMGRQVAAVAHATIATNLDEAFDVHLHFAAQIAFDFKVLSDKVTNEADFSLGQILDASIRINARAFKNLICTCGTNPKNVSQSNFDPLITRKINTFNSSHMSLSLSLFVLWVFADHI